MGPPHGAGASSTGKQLSWGGRDSSPAEIAGGFWKGIAILTLAADVAQLVEHNLAKVGVASSNLVVRST